MRTADEPEISIIVVTFNNTGQIGQCLAAISRAEARCRAEVVVVDNASQDLTIAVARAAAPDAKVLGQEVNGGFAAGCHAGANATSGRWLLFLNPDTVIAEEAIGALLECAAAAPTVGIVGGRFIHEDGSTDPRSWWGRPGMWAAFCFALGLSSVFAGNAIFDPEAPVPWGPELTETRQVAVVTGAFMLVRRELWIELGGFDRAFFMYGEDADFCLRAAAAGYDIKVTARAVCRHSGGKSSTGAGKMIMLFTGKSTLARRHYHYGLWRAYVLLLQCGVLVRAFAPRTGNIASASHSRRPTTAPTDWRALWSARDDWRRGWAMAARGD
jgi:N-acetylglucosaminyl-diphospho-decaprenol L-rhamnosyltransferase